MEILEALKKIIKEEVKAWAKWERNLVGVNIEKNNP